MFIWNPDIACEPKFIWDPNIACGSILIWNPGMTCELGTMWCPKKVYGDPKCTWNPKKLDDNQN